MLNKEMVSTLNISGKNILKDNTSYSINNIYDSNSNELSNIIINSNLTNENMIK
ncbi:hypothetical protein SAMN04487886_103615 [Clostridium sp. DSM 8431]|uniref:hypothetical protein n=1 Tax=Clostridium sp. DSM 8431 TaxID=1761781 RepID=UPI0008E9A3AE|nr:hypothetical protein [Clostridium sp. DSM 8431]SFU47647.1 hypothetical protein SAMN04487886_103615 [Clostridium sp. DSM 8431]